MTKDEATYSPPKTYLLEFTDTYAWHNTVS